MRVHVLQQIHDKAMNTLASQVNAVRPDDPEVFDLSRADGVIIRVGKITRAMMEQAPRLKVIGNHGVGVDGIDLDAAEELGKVVVYTPLGNMQSVAELAVCFMLSLARQLPRAHLMQREGRISGHAPKELTGVEMAGKTAGLVGLGRVGRQVAAILRGGFGMRLLGYAPSLSAAACAELGVEKVETLEELLAQAQYINISVPLTPATANMIDARRLALCRPDAILVNTARGGIIDEAALYDALKHNRIRAAASDVFTVEPLPADHPLSTLPNFAATPHLAASTEESLLRTGETVVDDVLRVLRGQEPLYPYRRR